MKRRLAAFGLGVARTRAGGRLAAWVLTSIPSVLPLHRLRETPTLLAFLHPSPSYAFHALIIPRRRIANLEAITLADTPFLLEVFETAHSLVEEFDLEQAGCCLVVNSGKFQEFPLLHFHLISDSERSFPANLTLTGGLFA